MCHVLKYYWKLKFLSPNVFIFLTKAGLTEALSTSSLSSSSPCALCNLLTLIGDSVKLKKKTVKKEEEESSFKLITVFADNGEALHTIISQNLFELSNSSKD